MVVPTHVEFGLPEKYKDMSKSEKDSIDSIYKNMDKDVKTVDAYDNLKKHKDEYIYFNTDHHWTSLGAYYAYQSFGKRSRI
ncbi:DHHW family protein [Paraclostridium bifermentans]|nr:DHHW family protein [Paraclostridium bifermentans]